MSDVFISYARTTAPKARLVAEALGREGYDVWWDEDLPAHRSFSDVIDERLRNSKAIVVIWSDAAVRSDWVRAEADFARTHGKLVQASADRALPPIPFNQIQCANLNDWDANPDDPEWRRVLSSVGALTGRTTPPVSLRGDARSSRGSSHRLWISAAVFIMFAAVAAWFFVAPHRTPQDAPDAATRVALLPFDVLDSDSKTTTFAAALADEIAGVLNENQFQSVPPSESAALTGPDGENARRRLGVGLILAGSVRTTDNVLQVRAHLDDPRARVTLWSSQFERPVDQSEALRDEVAVAITDVLYFAVDPNKQRGLSVDAQTLALYIKGHAALNTPTPLNKGQARTAFEQVVARAPDFASGRASLALSLMEGGDAQGARREAEQAIAIDPHNAGPAYDTLYWLQHAQSPRDLAKLEDVLLKGLKAAPDFAFLNMRECELLLDVGRLNDALGYCQRAISLRPLAAPISWRFAYALYAAGQREAAQSAIDTSVRVHPASTMARVTQFEMAAFGGSANAALDMLHDPPPGYWFEGPGVEVLAAFLNARKSPTQSSIDAALARFRSAVAARQASTYPHYLMMAASMLGRTDIAFVGLDDFAGQPATAPFASDTRYLFDPATAPLRRDTRFLSVADRLGLIRYWRERNLWPDFCSDPALPYDCRAEADRIYPANSSPTNP